jgi:hypothetical protein
VVAVGANSTVLPQAVGAVALGGAVAHEPRSLVVNGRAFASDFVLGGFGDDKTLSAALSAVAELRARVEALEAAATAVRRS